MSALVETIHAPLTRAEFNAGAAFPGTRIPIVTDEDGRFAFAYGHVDTYLFAHAVADYDAKWGEEADPPYTMFDAEHRYAVTLEPSGAVEGWLITWRDDVQNHPARFPVTVLHR